MSANVTFEAIRKTDGIPYFTAYLGGNGTQDYLQALYGQQLMETENGYILSLYYPEIYSFLAAMQNELYAGHRLEDCLEFLKRDDADNFHYFIQISI